MGVSVVSSLGFSFGSLDPGYVFHRMLDAMLRIDLNLIPDDSEPYASFGIYTPTALGPRTTETVCIKVAIRLNEIGKGNVYIARSSGSTWQFQRVYKSLMCLVEDLVESSTHSSSQFKLGSSSSHFKLGS